MSAHSSGFHALAKLLCKWAEQHYPYWRRAKITIDVGDGDEVQLPIHRFHQAHNLPAHDDETVEERAPTPCERDILAALRDAGRRMTTNQILAELDRRQMIHGESTAKRTLARLVQQGILDSGPGGYGIISHNADH